MQDIIYLLICFGGVFLLTQVFGKKRNAVVRTAGGILDRVLIWWSDKDPLTVRDLLNGGIAIFGRTGSGKTSSSGKCLARGIVGLPGTGGLILAAKPEDIDDWKAIFAEAGRSRDLLVFGGTDLRCNFLDYIRQMGWDAREMAKMLMVIGEGLNSNDSKGGEDSDFWEKQQFRMIYFACLTVQLAYGKVSATNLQKFVSGAARTAAQVGDAAWSKTFHPETIRLALNNVKTQRDKHDLEQATEYNLRELPALADRTRSSIETGVFGILHVYCTGAVHDLVSTTTNCSPDDTLRGKFILVNLAPSDTGDLGLFVGGGFKYLTQRLILKRKAEGNDPPHVIWADEAQTRVTSYDSHYLAQCRSHRGCMIYLSQSIHSYYSALGGEKGKHQADALLTNFAAGKVFHALGDVQTAEWAAGMIGKSLQTFVGGSMAPQEEPWGELMGNSKYTGSYSQHYEQILQPNTFLNGLRTGGEENGLICDCIVIRSGKAFASGDNWLLTYFSQK
ncbi:type IV secretory system conjugative DNA transfer family protein [Limnoglobus roseus]|uniref:TraD/TraG TraM recognition site domain-containing protein n=1 Tax=Limnoglobus roseus TaxID=2598579 RepID=A0A5C1AJC4_9BACT|nr:type IV secretory system conjugative DNA transfer family protein [Limnoglobus roseus]QEL18775.1 hypothetical protein PX52LOC_05814 [Limnoglobus roseus]